jgi:hypothetical protein
MFVFDCALGYKTARFNISITDPNPAIAHAAAKQEAEKLFRWTFGSCPEAIVLVPTKYQ